MQAVEVVPLVPVPGPPPPGRFAWLADAAAGDPPPLPASCAACLLPPATAAHADVARLRRWLDAAAGAPNRPLCVHRKALGPGDPLGPRLAVAFAHVCTVLGVPAAVELGEGDPSLDPVLHRWPSLGIAVWAEDVEGLIRAARPLGPRLAVAGVPATCAAEALRAWGALPGARGLLLAG